MVILSGDAEMSWSCDRQLIKLNDAVIRRDEYGFSMSGLCPAVSVLYQMSCQNILFSRQAAEHTKLL